MNVLIYNGFWNDGPPATVRMLAEAAAARHIELRVTPHTRWTAGYTDRTRVYGPDGHTAGAGDRVLFWDKDVRLARALEAAGAAVFNPADAIALCDDKSATHAALARHGIAMPETLVAPMAYTEVGEEIRAFLDLSERRLGYPMVVKECFGSLGGQVYLAKDRAELTRLAFAMGPRPFLTQRFLSGCAGQDWRLYTVAGRVVAAMHRSHPGDVRANLAAGGQAEAYVPTAEETACALTCCRALGLAFGAVDLLRDEDGRPLVCEVNSNAFIEGITACTGVDVAGEILHCAFGG